jgi:hypothetical protein
MAYYLGVTKNHAIANKNASGQYARSPSFQPNN